MKNSILKFALISFIFLLEPNIAYTASKDFYQAYYKLPPDWELITSNKKGINNVLKYAPKGDSISNWEEMIIMKNTDGSTMFIDQYIRIMKNEERNNQRLMLIPPEYKEINGILVAKYSVSFSQSPNCGSRCGEFWTSLVARNSVQTIEITRTWRGPMFASKTIPLSKEKIAEWDEFFNNIKICPIKMDKAKCQKWK